MQGTDLSSTVQILEQLKNNQPITEGFGKVLAADLVEAILSAAPMAHAQSAPAAARIPAAASMCEREPDHPWCHPMPTPSPVTLTSAHRETLENMAHEYQFGGGALRRQAGLSGRNGENREREGGNVDTWSADKDGDCEDKARHQFDVLRRDHPELAAAARPVLFRGHPDANGRISNQGHVALAIHTDQGIHILDASHSRLRHIDDYAHMRAFFPDGEGGVGGRWMHRPNNPATPAAGTP